MWKQQTRLQTEGKSQQGRGRSQREKSNRTGSLGHMKGLEENAEVCIHWRKERKRGKEANEEERDDNVSCQCSLDVTHSASVPKQELKWEGESV